MRGFAVSYYYGPYFRWIGLKSCGRLTVRGSLLRGLANSPPNSAKDVMACCFLSWSCMGCVSFSKCVDGPEDAAQLAGVFTLSVVVAS